MNKNSVIKRLEALENQTTKNNRVAVFCVSPDGRVDGDPAEVASAGTTVCINYVEPSRGHSGPETEDELEAKYPGRRERLSAWDRAVKACEARVGRW